MEFNVTAEKWNFLKCGPTYKVTGSHGGLKHPKMDQMLITSQENGMKGWNLTFRLIIT